jgi:hypothetical protein
MNMTAHKTAVLMAFHWRLGADSTLNRAFAESSIGDVQVLRVVWEMLWAHPAKQSAQRAKAQYTSNYNYTNLPYSDGHERAARRDPHH